MKKLLTGILIASLLIVAGCSGSGSGVADKAGKGEISVSEGGYFISKKDPAKKYLGIKINLENKSENYDDFSTQNYYLKSGPRTIKPTPKFARVTDVLDEGDSKSAYVYFDVDKSKEYELKYKSDGLVSNTIKIKPSDYSDNSNQPVDALKAVINEIMLGKTDANYEKMVADDKQNLMTIINNDAKRVFNKQGRQYTGDKFDIADTVNKMLQKRNATDGKVNYKLVKYTHNKATVKVHVESVKLDESKDDDDQYDAMANVLPAGKSYDEDNIDDALRAKLEDASVTAFQKEINDAPIKWSDNLQIKLEKQDDGKWTVYSGLNNDDAEVFENDLVSAFMGYLIDEF